MVNNYYVARDFSASQKRFLLFFLASIQCFNILEFMIMMPLGPDISHDLQFDLAHYGWVAGSYMAAAAISGLLCAPFLDRIKRKTALFITLTGLFIATFLAGYSESFLTLVIFRIIAGAFGGPATALCHAIIADHFPANQRGRALSKMLLAFTVASVFGVPLGLEISNYWSWQLCFILISVAGFIVTFIGLYKLPELQQERSHSILTYRIILLNWRRRPYVIAMITNSLAMAAGFMIIPHLSSFFQFNMTMPRSDMAWLYFVGGASTFLSTPLAGKLVDSVPIYRIAMISSTLIVILLTSMFVISPPVLNPFVFFVGFMLALSLRNLSMHSLASRVPAPSERAGFMVLLSSIQHIGSALGAISSGIILSIDKNQSLVGIGYLACISMAISLLLPWLMYYTERHHPIGANQPFNK
jgi:predicted MFS family arabinose efflux permease